VTTDPTVLDATTAPVERTASPIVVWSIDPGTLLAGRYRVEEKLGEGAMACVYRGRDRETDRIVALKVLDPLRGADPVGRARFERELLVLSRLSHPGVARSYGRARHDDLDILVLEHLEGETLASRLERGRLDVAEALWIGRKLSEALAFCHGEGILHRDLKPENVILHPDRGPVVLDFGVAWFSAAATLTRTGAVIGSPRYIAPEVLRTSLFDARADVYALGVILYEMLAGRSPYGDESADALALAHATREPPSLFRLRPEVGPSLSRVVGRAIAPMAEHRFATPGELAAALARGDVAAGKALEARLPCASCGTDRIVHLPICPGCGKPVVWELEPGLHAVQIDRIDDLDRVLKWLSRRHGAALRGRSPAVLKERLHFQPVPLAVGVSRQSAEQLASEAIEAGAQPLVIETRRLGGPSLKASEATTMEALAAIGLHFIATIGLGLLLAVLGQPLVVLLSLPGIVGALGIGIGVWYTRRPVLVVREELAARSPFPGDLRRSAQVLGSLQHERSRRLAAQAIARAAPILIGDGAGIPGDAAREVLERLEAALGAVRDSDTHLAYLLARPRAKLAHEMESAKARADLGDPAALDALRTLEDEKRELTESAIAYDVSVRAALDACAEISALVSTRSLPSSV
jgi:serine/threonine protein kinase